MFFVISTWLGVLGARSTNRCDTKKTIRTVDVVISYPNGPNISVQKGEQRGSDAAHSKKREFGDCRSQALKKTTTQPHSTAQMGVPHMHGVACWCCWAAFF